MVDIAAIENDPLDWLAKRLGVTVEQYQEWVETEGQPRCGGLTVTGRKCRNPVSGGIQRSLSDWINLDGDYCAVHGGESSKEARR